jgi:hypothetical protein
MVVKLGLKHYGLKIYVERVLNGAEKDCPQLDLMRNWGK